MGSEKKWIYLSYITATFLVAWVFNRLLILLATAFEIPNPIEMGVVPRSMVIAFAVTAIVAYFYFRQPKVNQYSTEVVKEMKKVTWAPRKTSWLSTIVVVISVMLMSAILGVYDFVCSKLISLLLGT